MSEEKFEPVEYTELEPDVMQQRAQAFWQQMRRRRSVRQFSGRPIPPQVIAACLRTASSAPSGANMQPWHFVLVSDPTVKQQIRIAAEQEEQAFYGHRASQQWLEALRPLGTDASKPFLEEAPLLIAIFAQSYHLTDEGEKVQHYYVNESVGIATGFLIAALHNAGLACLTHTPSPMRFLNEILERPSFERPFLLLVVGYPAAQAQVPVLSKKGLEEIATFL